MRACRSILTDVTFEAQERLAALGIDTSERRLVILAWDYNYRRMYFGMRGR